jgi:N-methylhydantoinase B/oxoprolinase/acetone carboxylase alpha subunit
MPVVLRKVSLRPNRGGGRQLQGGDRVVRDVEFRINDSFHPFCTRTFAPYGIAGGEPQKCALHLWIRKNRRTVIVEGKNSVAVETGNRLVGNSPGRRRYGLKKATS